MKLTLGFSPCPNDTFIFDAMIHQKIDTEGLEFDLTIADVEELNKEAFKKQIDITKISYNAFAHLINDYKLLNSGSALGNNCGPLLVTANPNMVLDADSKIAIPGKFTTANFLLSIFYPELTNKTEFLFSDIEKVLINQTYDAGLLIHENRFTYQERGLHKLADLGEKWEIATKLPIPLGGIIVNRNLDTDIQQKVDRVLKRSLQFAFDNPKSGIDFIKSHAQEMNEEVMYKHIELYVNNYTLDLGVNGKKAVEFLLNKAIEVGLIPKFDIEIFV